MDRVLTAIKTLRASPDIEARFLKAGSKVAWPKMLVEWSDAVAQTDDELKPGVRIYRKDIPLEPFMDFVAVKNGVPPRDDEEEQEREEPTRKAYSDMLIAGEWWAKLALTVPYAGDPGNIDEFERNVEKYRRGEAKNCFVKDQIFLLLLSQGWSLYSIGKRFKLNDDETHERYFAIAQNIFYIANRKARLADPAERAREKRLKQSGDRSCRERA
jgi:hypothetical protein